MIRQVYDLEDGYIKQVRAERINQYFRTNIYATRNEIVIHLMNRKELKRNQILFDVEWISKRREQGYLKGVKGFAPSFLNQMKEFDISEEELKRRIKNGKGDSKRKYTITRLAEGLYERNFGFVVGQ